MNLFSFCIETYSINIILFYISCNIFSLFIFLIQCYYYCKKRNLEESVMIKNIIAKNKIITPDIKELSFLKETFPSCFKADGSFDMSRFYEFLKDKINISHEGYELEFLGKNYAKMPASLESGTVIVPDEIHNILPENKNSQNVYISGDNLDAIKHLLKSYHKQIKCIYIDLPYNTGTDGFTYNDKFNFTVDENQTNLIE